MTALGRARAHWLRSCVCAAGFLFGYDSGKWALIRVTDSNYEYGGSNLFTAALVRLPALLLAMELVVDFQTRGFLTLASYEKSFHPNERPECRHCQSEFSHWAPSW